MITPAPDPDLGSPVGVLGEALGRVLQVRDGIASYMLGANGNYDGQVYRVAELAAAGLTPELLDRCLRNDGPNLGRDAVAVCRGIQAGVDVELFADAAALGCDPLVLERLVFSGPDPRPDLIRVLLDAAAAGPSPKNRLGWRLLCEAVRELTHRRGFDPVAVLAGMWALDDRPAWAITAWCAFVPPGADPSRWLAAAARWQIAGITTEEGRRYWDLPTGHPDVPSAEDLAVLAALRRA